MNDPTRLHRPSARAVVIAVAITVALIAASCGGSSNNDSSGGTTDTTASAGVNVTLAADGPPQTGGTLHFAVASETDGWTPSQNRWAGDGTIIGLSIFDPLAAFNADGHWAPYLAESLTPNADFTEWTIKLRDGVQFHDGTPLDAEAVRRNLEATRSSVLLGPALASVDTITVTDPLTLVVTMKEPWAEFPTYLCGQGGAIAAPSQLDNPDGTRNPVGTGPFEFVSWEPDRNLVVKRNPNYWRKDEDGTQLPYLDQIVFTPILDSDQRITSLEAGDQDMTWNIEAGPTLKLRNLASQGKIQLVEQQGQTEVTFVILNLAAPPFDNPDARKAVALATDREAWVHVIAQDVTNPARTLFRPGSKWYSDIEEPAYDLEGAKQAVAAYEATNGPLNITLNVISTPGGRQQGEFLKSIWEQAGMHVDINQLEGTTFLLNAVNGDFQSAVWAQFGSPDPDYEHVWWLSSSSAPVGQLSLNFPRNKDPQIDQALAQARATDDTATRKAAYDIVQQRFVEDLPYIYLDYEQSVIAANNNVRGLTNGPLPDGEPSLPMGGPGSFSYAIRLVQTWLTG